MLRSLCCGGVTLLSVLVLTATSAGGGGDQAAAKAAQAGDIELLTAAFTLAETAQKFKLPEVYVAAGRLLLRFDKQTGGKVGNVDVKPIVEDENGKPVQDAKATDRKAESFAALA